MTRTEALERALRDVVKHIPELWGDHVVDGHLSVELSDDDVYAIEAALALPPSPCPGCEYTKGAATDYEKLLEWLDGGPLLLTARGAILGLAAERDREKARADRLQAVEDPWRDAEFIEEDNHYEYWRVPHPPAKTKETGK